MAEGRFAHHRASEEGPQSERNAEQRRSPVGNADGRSNHREREQFARARLHHLPQQPGQHAAAHQQHQGDECRHLQQGLAQSLPQRACLFGRRGAATQQTGQRRHQHQHQHAGQVFHHQPAHGNAAVHRVEHARASRALSTPPCWRTRATVQNQTAAHAPAHPPRQPHAQQGGHAHLHHRARHRQAAHREQIAQRKCSPRQTSAASRQFQTTARQCATSATKPGVAGPIRMPASR